jgi:hypothetical protein
MKKTAIVKRGRGRPRLEVEKCEFSVRVDKEMLDRLDSESWRHGLSRNRMVVHFLAYALQHAR